MTLSRVHLCQQCGEPWEEARVSAQGRPPAACPACDPAAAHERERLRVKRAGLQAQLEASQDRVAELEAQIAAMTEGADRRRYDRSVEPSREAVSRAIRRVAHAEGQDGTRRALLDLAVEAQAWAAVIAVPVGTDDRLGNEGRGMSVPCPRCDGNGVIYVPGPRDSFGASESEEWTCPKCGGAGVTTAAAA